jgi:hypothetical protein
MPVTSPCLELKYCASQALGFSFNRAFKSLSLLFHTQQDFYSGGVLELNN